MARKPTRVGLHLENREEKGRQRAAKIMDKTIRDIRLLPNLRNSAYHVSDKDVEAMRRRLMQEVDEAFLILKGGRGAGFRFE